MFRSRDGESPHLGLARFEFLAFATNDKEYCKITSKEKKKKKEKKNINHNKLRRVRVQVNKSVEGKDGVDLKTPCMFREEQKVIAVNDIPPPMFNDFRNYGMNSISSSQSQSSRCGSGRRGPSINPSTFLLSASPFKKSVSYFFSQKVEGQEPVARDVMSFPAWLCPPPPPSPAFPPTRWNLERFGREHAHTSTQII